MSSETSTSAGTYSFHGRFMERNSKYYITTPLPAVIHLKFWRTEWACQVTKILAEKTMPGDLLTPVLYVSVIIFTHASLLAVLQQTGK